MCLHLLSFQNISSHGAGKQFRRDNIQNTLMNSKCRKKGRKSVRKSRGYHVWQEKSCINTAEGTNGRTPVLGRQRSRGYSGFHSKGKATTSQMVRNSLADVLCPVWDFYSKRDTGQLERAQKTAPRTSKKHRPLEKTSLHLKKWKPCYSKRCSRQR